MLILTSSVVVGEFHVMSLAIAPHEADPPLVVDPDAVLTLPVTAERLQTVARHRTQLVETLCRMDYLELASGPRDDPMVDTPYVPALEQRGGAPVSKAPDHDGNVPRNHRDAKRNGLDGRSEGDSAHGQA
jgi:hypothetical protein